MNKLIEKIDSSRWKPYIMLLPALFVVIVLFGGGLMLGLIKSLGYQPLLGKTELTLQFYRQVLTDPDFIVNLKHTFFIAFVSTVLSTVIGVALAVVLVRKVKKWPQLRFIYKLPMVVPHLVAGFMITDFLSQGGLIARLLFHLGIIDQMGQFPVLVYDKLGLGIIFVYLWKEIPFITLMVFSVMEKINDHLWEAASNLGANFWQIWLRVVLPLSLPSIISAAMIVFAYAFGAFEVPYLVGSIYPTTLSVWAFKSHINADLYRRPEAMAISMIIAVVTLISVWIYIRFSNAYIEEKIVHNSPKRGGEE